MENLITKILRDFEDGLMNRRQLIHSLTIAAAVGGGAAAVEAQTPSNKTLSKSPFKTVELDHISYQVKDYRVTRDFYADLMGMEVRNDNGKTQCELYFGNSMLLARNHFRPRGQEEAPAAAPAPAVSANGRPQPTSLVDHISYRIFDWDTDQVREELLRRNLMKETTKPDTGGGIPNYSSFHVSDPDGFNLQISGYAGPKDSVNKK
jgi:catechol 2,3-dioxygenase-like lactoylglutathione lyase family enzyme